MQTLRRIARALGAISIITFAGYLMLFWAMAPAWEVNTKLAHYQQMDQQALAHFQESLHSRIVGLRDRTNNFMEELTEWGGLRLIWNTVTFNKEEFVRNLWEKHFNREIQSITSELAQGLLMDIQANNNQLLIELKQDVALDVQPAIKLIIEQQMIKYFQELTLDKAQYAANLSMGGNILALVSGSLVGTAVATILEATWVGAVLGILTDVLVTKIVDDKVNQICHEKINIALTQTADAVIYGFNGKPGVVQIMANTLHKYHDFQKQTILSAIQQ